LNEFDTKGNSNKQIKQTNWTVPDGTQITVGRFHLPPVKTGGYDVLRA